MNLNSTIKKWLVDHCEVKNDATDEEFRTSLAKALADGKLSAADLVEMQKDKDADAANVYMQKLDSLQNMLEKFAESLVAKQAEKPEPEPAPEPAPVKSVGDLPKDLTNPGEEKDGEVRVKGAWVQYSTTTKSMQYPAFTKAGRPHPMAGRQVIDFNESGRPLNEPSDLDKAVAGAYAKYAINVSRHKGSKTYGFQTLSDHDKELLQFAMKELPWSGSTDGGPFADIKNRRLSPQEQKALIDDATSGGLEAAPIAFDDMVIQTPLLHGELFPLVNTVPLDRGRRVEGVSTGTVTAGWGGADDSAISLFNTASYVSAFDTTVFRWEGAIQIGLDFLSDSPIDFGAHVTQQYGERLLEDLDDVIAAGNGTTQPEGIINKSGTTSVNFGGATSLGNYESLRFGVAKAEHRGQAGNSAVFCGTETSYQRARAIPVGASDARRLGGMDYSSYTWMERPYKINESLTNAQIFYAVLNRYRMYVRRGLTVRTSTEGDTLLRKNEMLVVVTARYGGQLERGGAAAITTTAPA